MGKREQVAREWEAKLCNKLLAKTKCKLHIYIDGFVWARQWWAVATPPRLPLLHVVGVGSGRGAVCAPQTRCRRRSQANAASRTRNFLTRELAKLFCKYLFSICCCCCSKVKCSLLSPAPCHTSNYSPSLPCLPLSMWAED